MDAIETTLGQFSDRELAFFYKYQLSHYLFETQLKLRNYIHNIRGLSEQKIDQLVLTEPPDNLNPETAHCPRCKSQKLLTGKEDISFSGNSPKIACRVCGYIVVNTEEDGETWFGHILDLIPDS